MIDLPLSPSPASATPALLFFGAQLTPSLGGPVQQVERMGSRFRLSVTMPPMRGAMARQWVARLVRGKSAGVRMPFPLLDFKPGVPGQFLVNGAGQAGKGLAIDGGRANYVFREGQFFSILTGGRHYVHMITAETIASGAGSATIPIEPMLRVSPADNAELHVGRPMIEGFIAGEEWAWEMSLAHFQQLSFDIAEAE